MSDKTSLQMTYDVGVWRQGGSMEEATKLYEMTREIGDRYVYVVREVEEPYDHPGSDISFFFFSSRRRHTRSDRDWSSDVCSYDLNAGEFFRCSYHSWTFHHDGKLRAIPMMESGYAGTRWTRDNPDCNMKRAARVEN